MSSRNPSPPNSQTGGCPGCAVPPEVPASLTWCQEGRLQTSPKSPLFDYRTGAIFALPGLAVKVPLEIWRSRPASHCQRKELSAKLAEGLPVHRWAAEAEAKSRTEAFRFRFGLKFRRYRSRLQAGWKCYLGG